MSKARNLTRDSKTPIVVPIVPTVISEVTTLAYLEPSKVDAIIVKTVMPTHYFNQWSSK